MNKYKEDLDKVREEKNFYRSRIRSEEESAKLPLEQHNTLINPVPYNIQNPYILREMNRQTSYFANIANQNLSNGHH